MKPKQYTLRLALGCFLLWPSLSLAKDCTWTVKGTLKVTHLLEELKDKYIASYLKGVKVKVSAKEKVIGVWGTWNSWDTVETNANGEFSVSKEKNCDERRFKVEFKFDNDELHVIDYGWDTEWYTLKEESSGEHKAGTTHFGDMTIPSSLGDETNLARKQADIWVLYNKVFDQLASYGSSYKFTKKVEVKYPSNPLGKDNGSYADPITQNVHIIKEDGNDDFRTDIMIHELMHIWAYQHVSGALGLATNLISTWDTHCTEQQSSIVFHEAFAEFAMQKLANEMFAGHDLFDAHETLALNKDALQEGLNCWAYQTKILGIRNGFDPDGKDGSDVVDPFTSIEDMEDHEFGWMSLFYTLTTPNLEDYSYTSTEATSKDLSHTSTRIAKKTMLNQCASVTGYALKDILKVFLANSSAGYDKNLKGAEMNFTDFMTRAAKILNFTDKKQAYLDLLNPAKTTDTQDVLCAPILAPTGSFNRPPKGGKQRGN